MYKRQDLGVQGYALPPMSNGDIILAKPLQNGDIAFCLLNEGDSPKKMILSWQYCGWEMTDRVKLRDVIAHVDLSLIHILRYDQPDEPKQPGKAYDSRRTGAGTHQTKQPHPFDPDAQRERHTVSLSLIHICVKLPSWASAPDSVSASMPMDSVLSLIHI